MRMIATALVSLLLLISTPTVALTNDEPGPALAKTLGNFFGRTRGSYLIPDTLVSKQTMLALSGPGEVLTSTNGGRVYVYCRAKSCQEKARVYLDRDGAIVTVGLINYACHRPDPGKSKPKRAVVCARKPQVDIFKSAKATLDDVETVREWAVEVAGVHRDVMHAVKPAG